MGWTRIVMLSLVFLPAAAAQETRREVVNPSADAAADSKPNSAEVPEVYAMSGRFERIVVLRFKNQADLAAGLQRMVQEERIRNAVILSGAGSVLSYHVHQVSNRSFPSRNTFVRNPTGPADLVGMNGYVIDGRVHAHVTLASPDRAFGGHLEPGTNVFTFAIVTLGVLSGEVDLGRADDKSYR